jgi:signal transduction histidine kinase
VRWRLTSFRQQLLTAFLVLALLPSLLLTLFTTCQARRQQQDTLKRLQATSLHGALEGRDYLAAAVAAGARVVADLSDEPWLVTASRPADRMRLRQHLAAVPLGYNLGVLDPTGRILTEARFAKSPPGRDFKLVAFASPQALLGERGLIVSRTYRLRGDGGPGTAVARVIRTPDGRPVGFAFVSFDLRPYHAQLQDTAKADPSSLNYVVGTDGHLYFSAGGDHGVPDLRNMSDDPAFRAAQRLRRPGTMGLYRSPLANRDLVGGFAVVPQTGWVMVVASDVSAIVQEARRSAWTAWALLIPAGCLALLGALWLSRWYSRPVTDLCRVVRGMADGRPVSAPPSARTADEFGVLAEAIVDTSRDLARNAAALASSRADLERELASRTQSLVATNRIIALLAGATDLRAACQAVAPLVASLIGADAVVICRLDEAQRSLDVLAHVPTSLPCPETMRLAETPFGDSLPAGRTWIDPALPTDSPFTDVAVLATQGYQSRAVLPVRRRMGPVIAAINLISRTPVAYDESVTECLQAVIEQVGMAFERDRLLQVTEARRQDAEGLAAMAAAFGRSVRLEDVSPVVLQAIRTAGEADRADLWLIDDTGQRARCVAADGSHAAVAVGLTMTGTEYPRHAERLQRLARGEPLLLAGSGDMDLDRDVLARLEVDSAALLPLSTAGRLIGFLLLAYCSPERRLPMARLAFVQAIAGQAASAVANADLVDRLERTLERLQAVQEQLVRSERLSALGQLASFVTHEIKNRFNVIMTAATLAEMVAGRTGSPERIKQTMATIKREVDRGNDLMLRLLSFAKPVAPSLSLVSLPAVLDSALLTARRANVTVVRHLPADLPPVRGDPALLEQVFLNLILNALQAMPGGGTLTVSAAVSGAWVELQLSDTGAGMSAETLSHLFQPFFTTKPQGTGLGLVITRQIIDQHRGSVHCESTPGQGTTFTIRLPLAEAAQAPDITEAASDREEQAG